MVAGHGVYLRSMPDSDARLAHAPTEVRVEFSEAPDPRGSELLVLDTTGARVDLGGVSSSDAMRPFRGDPGQRRREPLSDLGTRA